MTNCLSVVSIIDYLFNRKQINFTKSNQRHELFIFTVYDAGKILFKSLIECYIYLKQVVGNFLIVSVCVCLPAEAIAFQWVHIETSYLIWWYILSIFISRSSLNIKVIESMSSIITQQAMFCCLKQRFFPALGPKGPQVGLIHSSLWSETTQPTKECKVP